MKKKPKFVTVAYKIYEGSPAWESIVRNPIPRTTRLHELVTRGIIHERFGDSHSLKEYSQPKSGLLSSHPQPPQSKANTSVEEPAALQKGSSAPNLVDSSDLLEGDMDDFLKLGGIGGDSNAGKSA